MQTHGTTMSRVRCVTETLVCLLKTLRSGSETSSHKKPQIYWVTFCEVLVYACATWKLSVADTKRVESFDNRCSTYVKENSWFDHISNAALHQLCVNVERFSSFVEKRRLQWSYQIFGRSEPKLSKNSLLDTSVAKRSHRLVLFMRISDRLGLPEYTTGIRTGFCSAKTVLQIATPGQLQLESVPKAELCLRRRKLHEYKGN